MPHSNGRIYTDHTVTPKLGIDATKDVAYVLGRTTGDWKQLCGDVDANGNDVNKVNIYAINKPVRWSGRRTPSAAERGALRYGLYLNSTLRPSLANQDPYWKYNKPRGGAYSERYRITDFDGYYHFAEAPMLQTSLAIDNNGQIHLDLRTIVNRSANVEIPVTYLFDFADQDYVGFVLWDVTRKFGYYCITNVYASDVVNNTIDTNACYDFMKNIVELPFSDDDVVEFFWCTNVNNTMIHDQEQDYPDMVRIPSGGLSTLALMACDSTHGHTTFVIVKLNFNTDLGFINRNTIVGGSWNASQTQWTLNSFSTELQCTYGWPRSGESYQTSWRISDGNSNIFTGDRYLSSANATQYFTLSLSNGSKTYPADQLRDDNYIITIYLYGKLTGSPTERLFATIRYNVQTGAITY